MLDDNLLLRVALAPIRLFTVPSERFFILYMATSVLIGCMIFVVRHRLSLAGFKKFLFPAKAWRHPSTLLDIRFLLVNSFVLTMVLVPIALVGPKVAYATTLLAGLMGLPGEGSVAPGPAVTLLATICLILAMDFAIFAIHMLQHRVPALWAFHKVHHTAETLTPAAVYRMHPIDDLMIGLGGACLTGIVAGLFRHVCPEGGQPLTVHGINLVLYLFYVAGYHFRHSEIWIDYPRAIGRILVSPAQHQIHHSADPRHFNRNYGFIFAVWDVAFGTHYLPRGREDLSFGLGDPSEAPPRRIADLYLLPFRTMAQQLRSPNGLRGPAILGTVLAVLVVGGVAVGQSATLSAPLSERVRLEELTWVEVRELLKAGKTTAIVPTGGVEQNGPHVVLGKHNYIVQHNADDIARRLGNALVAPVVTYVPEGPTEPPADHMLFPGTLSVPEDVFAAVLEHTARSLRAHGFTTICFVGDSGGNQPAQARVAEKLNAQWRGAGVRVLHVSDYYAANGQTAWLLAEGETTASIGSHAGIRDTSEMLAVNPDGIRPDRVSRNGGPYMENTGVIGDPTRASAERGRALLALKVEAAVRQIRHFTAGGA